MIEVASFLRRRDGSFVPVAEAGGAPPDPDYIEGSIDLRIDGVAILDKELWDYVDQLWAYIGDALIDLQRTSAGQLYFPDQPITLTFRRLAASRVLVTLESTKLRRSASADAQELMAALTAHATSFFHRLSELAPSNADSYRDAMSRFTEAGAIRTT